MLAEVALAVTDHKAAQAKAESAVVAAAQEITLILMDIIDNMLLVILQTANLVQEAAAVDQDTTEVFRTALAAKVDQA
jgi:hypothetical protein